MLLLMMQAQFGQAGKQGERGRVDMHLVYGVKRAVVRLMGREHKGLTKR